MRRPLLADSVVERLLSNNAERLLMAVLGLIVDGPSSTHCCLSHQGKQSFADLVERLRAELQEDRAMVSKSEPMEQNTYPRFTLLDTSRTLGGTAMNRLYQFVAIVLSLVVLPSAWAEDVPSKQIAARTELHPIQSLTLSDQEFLKGNAAGKQVTITGQLRIAQGIGRLPVVVLQHGSSGYAANVDVWSREFNEMGISTFALDGFTGRGLTEVNSNQALLGRLNLILDDYRVLAILATHPRVDSSRIVLMGFSRGGQAALYASLKRFNRMWNRSGVEYAAYIPFYPDCMTTFIADTDVESRPIRIFGGMLDDYNPIATCKAYVERLQLAGRDVELTEYPNASHAFDNPLGAQPAAVSPTFESARSCKIREEADGLLINVETKQLFTYKDACVERGPHLGHDPNATQAAKTAVKAFLRTVFKLD